MLLIVYTWMIMKEKGIFPSLFLFSWWLRGVVETSNYGDIGGSGNIGRLWSENNAFVSKKRILNVNFTYIVFFLTEV